MTGYVQFLAVLPRDCYQEKSFYPEVARIQNPGVNDVGVRNIITQHERHVTFRCLGDDPHSLV